MTGNSRGRWEGETLVVETTNFTDKTAFQGSSENMRLTERFTRVAEDTIDYRFTIDDPATWTRPWSAEMPMQKTIGPIFEHACHEGNYGLYNTLAGARSGRRGESGRRKPSQERVAKALGLSRRRRAAMSTKRAVVVAGVGLLLAAAPASAHHAFSAEFDVNKPMKLQGTLVKWEMINPHSWFHIDVKGPDGQVVRWIIEGGSPNQLIRLGVTKNTLSAGMELSSKAIWRGTGRTKASAAISCSRTDRGSSSAALLQAATQVPP